MQSASSHEDGLLSELLTLSKELEVKGGEGEVDHRIAVFDRIAAMVTMKGNINIMVSPNAISLLTSIVLAIKANRCPGERVKAMQIIWTLSSGDHVETAMSSPALGLVASLAEVLKEDNREARIKALAIIGNLAFGDDEVKRHITALILEPYLEILKSDDCEVKTKALLGLAALSVGPESSAFMISYPGFLEQFVCLLREEGGDSSGISSSYDVYSATAPVMSAIYNFSSGENIETIMTAPALGLLEQLVLVINREERRDTRIQAIAAISNLSYGDKEVKKLMVGHPHLLETLVGLIKEGGDNRLRALTAVLNFSAGENVEFCMTAPSLGLIDELVDVIKEDRGDARGKCLATIWNLSWGNDETKTLFTHPALGLLELYVEILKSDKGEARRKSLGALTNFALGSMKIKKWITAPELGLLEQLALIIKDTNSSDVKARETAISVIWSLVSGKWDEIVENLLDPRLGVVNSLVENIKIDRAEPRRRALGVLTCFSVCNDDVRSILINSEVIKLFEDIIKSDKSELGESALSIISNLSGSNSASICSKLKSIGFPSRALISDLVAGLKANVVDDDNDDNDDNDNDDDSNDSVGGGGGKSRARFLGCVWNLTIDFDNAILFLGYHLEVPLIELLKVYPSLTNDVGSRLLTTLMCFCRHPLAAKAVRNSLDSAALQALEPIAKQKDSMGLRALFVISQLVGRDEADKRANTLSLLETRPETLDQIVDVLQNNIAGLDGQDYEFGNFDLNAVASAVLSLSISDSNKKLLVRNPHLLLSLVHLLKAFTDNEQPVLHANSLRGGIGGGGDDVETASYVVETLLQLSFYYPDDDSLIREYMTSDLGLEDLLMRFLSLGSDRKVGFEASRSASNLLKRLQRLTATPPTPSTPSNPTFTPRSGGGGGSAATAASIVATSASKQHIMLSYAWGANKNNVIHLQHELQRLGYDVWRDEVGSSLVPPMSGGVDERMAEAIEASYAVVICVSPQYKESANCQMEAKYCNSLFKKKRLKLCYVMMDSDYHTNSLVCVNGWLAIMVGDALWYPLWDDSPSQVVSTAGSLAALFGDNAKTQHNQQQQQQQTSSVSSSQLKLLSVPVVVGSTPSSPGIDTSATASTYSSCAPPFPPPSTTSISTSSAPSNISTNATNATNATNTTTNIAAPSATIALAADELSLLNAADIDILRTFFKDNCGLGGAQSKTLAMMLVSKHSICSVKMMKRKHKAGALEALLADLDADSIAAIIDELATV